MITRIFPSTLETKWSAQTGCGGDKKIVNKNNPIAKINE
jgi:hypothetical protein